MQDAITEVVADIHPDAVATEAPATSDADALRRARDLEQDVHELFHVADLVKDLDLDKTDQTEHGARVSAVIAQLARMAGEFRRRYHDALWPGQDHSDVAPLPTT